MEWLKQFNTEYANAIQALTPFVIGIVSWLYFVVYKDSKLNEGDAASIVSPIFWTFGNKSKILAVHLFEIASEPSGYRHVSQKSRPDQWQSLFEIRSSYFGLRHV